MSLVNQMQSSANNFILTNGFLQPYSLFPIANFPAAVFAPAEIKVFPNPARDFVEIDFFMKQQGRLGLRLLDAAGQVVYSNAVNYYGLDLVHKIQVKQFSSGTYFLHVTLQGFGPYLSTFRTVRKGVYRIVKIP